MKYKIDVVRIRENSIQLNGWVIGKTPESKAEFEVLDQEKKPLSIKYVATRRDDVSQIYYKQVYDRDYGFDIQFPYERGADYWLVIRCDGKTARVKYNEELIAKRASVAHKRMEKIKRSHEHGNRACGTGVWKKAWLKGVAFEVPPQAAGPGQRL